jgi:hypothetical protein
MGFHYEDAASQWRRGLLYHPRHPIHLQVQVRDLVGTGARHLGRRSFQCCRVLG